ncbi:hypothetical protein GCM10018780_92890 [Streptomyces lanatus]|nr:hypothetical protein GCM10018780_92890 [Streptomyces lanatus]
MSTEGRPGRHTSAVIAYGGRVRTARRVSRQGLLRIRGADLVTAQVQSAYEPLEGLDSRHLVWVLSAQRRSWSTVVSRFGDKVPGV